MSNLLVLAVLDKIQTAGLITFGAGLGIFIIIFGAFLVLIRLNNFYTYVLEDDKIVIYKMFIFKREISLKEIDKIEQKSDGIKIYLKSQRKIFIDYMFDNQESLMKELRGNGIYLC
ncbi:PH domain-containing protein [Butyrivibrio fibrisolvens]|uniref:EbsA family protein n=1 Tax=Pseudobutyrivibrio ruminis TaxID=46206 RepID=UPI0004862FD1|nr:EbsA family protein [Pseudobutyrivibrio ruminis]MDC7279937.1 PH domain-containing protein [Butyrivibrio fibrisolvens]